ncbi:putative cytochrome P450 pisatin demethylase [Aspergillus saccharolyticus JOP 1030-1]|uniref:Cytochrome P450 pisatin demethylase n=1 Tax=Aspergillus saccharolyticus JOP 1030-1 TaxID=1450539 RepID=A0A318ZLC4_9EURO|nr:cytochrome P450 pisatin demethylase [Aspergillus saccharolyticus JOP 1030-1]PYH48399.1 cytochrome P450 pisatin demethylase [Aspergillus saccharolyticus JOP 1030-1]
MTSTVLTASQIVLVGFIVRVVYCCYFHPLVKYPGPWFSSSLWGQHHLTEESLHQRYGPIVRVAPIWLSSARLEDFEAIYGFNKSIKKDDFYTFGEKRCQSDVSVFATKSNVAHRRKRRNMLGPALTSSKVRRYGSIFAKHVEVLIRRLEESLGVQAGAVNVAQLTILFGPAVGPHPYTNDDLAGDIGASVRYVSRTVWSYSLWPAFGCLMKTRLATACLRRPRYNAAGAVGGLTGLINRGAAAIMGGPETFARHSRPGIVRSWLEISADAVHRLTPAETVSEALILVFAGPGSMAAALTAILYQWASQRVESGRRSFVSLELQAVIKETLRIHSPFPTAFPRVTRSGAENAIPSLSTYVLSRSREIWGDDADQWAPQRWIGEDGHLKGPAASVIFAKALKAIVQQWRFTAAAELRGRSYLEMQYDECHLHYTQLQRPPIAS